jgi:D-alanyl-D-alanine carboxypeptidase
MGFLLALLSLFAGLWSGRALAGSYSGLVVEMDTGRVLYERNADELRHPASVTKMMTLYLVFEALARGEITLESRFRASRYAVTRPPSKLGLAAGDTIAVEDAILSLVTQSANDVATLIGENLGGSEQEFAYMMTRKARELGMRRTVFRNASGLPDPDQWTTAWDMYRLGKALIQNFPEYYRYFSTQKFYYHGRGYGNHNHLMETYPGMDGIKTGFIHSSGFNLVASAKRNGHRLIGVVFGGPSAIRRDAHMRDILDDGFAQLDGEPSRVFTAEFDHPEPPGISGRTKLAGAKVFEYVEPDEVIGSEPVPVRRPAAVAEFKEPERISRLPPPQRSGKLYGDSAPEFVEPPAVEPEPPRPAVRRSEPPSRYAEAVDEAPVQPSRRVPAAAETEPVNDFMEPATVGQASAASEEPAPADDYRSPRRPSRKAAEPAYDAPPDDAGRAAETVAEFQEPATLAPAAASRRPARTETATADYVEPGLEPTPEPAYEERRAEFVEPDTVPEAADDDADDRYAEPEYEPRPDRQTRNTRRAVRKLAATTPVATPKTKALLYAQATASRRPEKPRAAPTPKAAAPKPAPAKAAERPPAAKTSRAPAPAPRPAAKPAAEKRAPAAAPAKPAKKEAKAEPAPKKAPACAAGKAKSAKCGSGR